jgi:hypothetical protein
VFSPYYQDQFDAWYNGRSFPMSFSDAAVEQATVHKLVLGPEKKFGGRGAGGEGVNAGKPETRSSIAGAARP